MVTGFETDDLLGNHTRLMVSYQRIASALPPWWFWVSSLALLLMGLVLFVLSLTVGDRGSRLFLEAIPCLLVCAVAVHAYYLLHAGRERQAIGGAFYAADKEFAAIFAHALDGIVTLDDQAVCLTANPAALRILGVNADELMGSSLCRYFADEQEFRCVWRGLIEGKDQRGNAQLRSRRNNAVFADFTIAANYLPGRHVAILCDATERRRAEAELRQSQKLLEEVTDNVQEIVWMIDPATKELLYVSKAYEAITGRPLGEARENPNLDKELLHPEDRGRFLDQLDKALISGRLDEEFRIIRPDGAIRWIWSKGTLYRGPGDPPRLVGIAQDISERKQAEFQIAKHLAAVEAARSEAEALRNSTLALTRNLRMDTVLDTLLALLREVVPYEDASVILADEEELYVARTSSKTVEMIEGRKNSFLEGVRASKKSVFFRDTAEVSGWEDREVLRGIRSWICVPLLASTEHSAGERLLGLLSVGHSQPQAFSTDHFRIAESLAVPAAVAIQNARLFERAEIYAAELQATAPRDRRQRPREPKTDA